MNVEYRQYFFDLRGRILSGQIKGSRYLRDAAEVS